jgi:hypothetical protein
MDDGVGQRLMRRQPDPMPGLVTEAKPTKHRAQPGSGGVQGIQSAGDREIEQHMRPSKSGIGKLDQYEILAVFGQN